MTSRHLFAFTALCFVAVGAMSLFEGGTSARLFQAMAFFGAGVAVAQVLRPMSPWTAAEARPQAWRPGLRSRPSEDAREH